MDTQEVPTTKAVGKNRQWILDARPVGTIDRQRVPLRARFSNPRWSVPQLLSNDLSNCSSRHSCVELRSSEAGRIFDRTIQKLCDAHRPSPAKVAEFDQIELMRTLNPYLRISMPPVEWSEARIYWLESCIYNDLGSEK